AGGLDGAMRLSELATEAILSGDLRSYNGARFQTRFLARRWMRVAMRFTPASVIEGAFLLIRPLAHHVFFSRGSFPDVGFTTERTKWTKLSPASSSSLW